MSTKTTGTSPGNRRAALTLVVLTPLIAELAFGSTPLRMAWLVLLWLPVYGAGILLVREAVRRTGRGWPSIVLLGLAYELAEDGIGIQALSSPHLYGAAGWAPRLFGLNVAYWEVNAIYHVVFSAVIPILLTDLLFPAHRTVPYLKRGGLVITGVVALLGLGLLRVSVPPSQDPGYVAPLPVLLGCVVAIAVLAVVALRVLPRSVLAPDSRAPVPSRGALAAFGCLGVGVVLGLLFPFGGARQPAFTHGLWVFLPMAVGAALAGLANVLVRRWGRSAHWTDRHALALAGGALVGHTLFGILAAADTTFDRIGLAGIAVVTVGLLAWLDGRLARRPAQPLTP
ncbi:hypothetical protein [Flindersiella endophytica]